MHPNRSLPTDIQITNRESRAYLALGQSPLSAHQTRWLALQLLIISGAFLDREPVSFGPSSKLPRTLYALENNILSAVCGFDDALVLQRVVANCKHSRAVWPYMSRLTRRVRSTCLARCSRRRPFCSALWNLDGKATINSTRAGHRWRDLARRPLFAPNIVHHWSRLSEPYTGRLSTNPCSPGNPHSCTTQVPQSSIVPV